MKEPIKILFFDDEPNLVCGITNSFKLLYGIDVNVVNHINTLFRDLNNDIFNVLVIDVMAPIPPANNTNVSFTTEEIEEMNQGLKTGVVLSKKIRAIEKYKNTPIIFVTACSENALESLRKQNATNIKYLRKPVTAIEIYNTIKEFGLIN